MLTTRSRHLFLLLYTAFILYGSLFPLVDWSTPPDGLLATWSETAGKHVSRSDLVTNLLAYVPFGYLLSSSLSGRFPGLRLIPLSLLAGVSLSFAMECGQLFLPARTSSPMDLLLNAVSSVSGALLYCWMGQGSRLGETLRQWRSVFFQEGKVTDIGIAVVAAWGASQLAPFVPSLDLGGIKNGLKPLWLTLHDPSRLNGFRLLAYGLNIGSLGAVLRLIATSRTKVPLWLGFFCGAVLACKIFVGRQLSLEAVGGLAVGVGVATALRRLAPGRCVLWGMGSVVAAFVVEELRPERSATAVLHDFNWIPFRSQMTENITGIASIIEGLWPFSLLGFLTITRYPSAQKALLVMAGMILATAVLALEYAQTAVVGRYPDITTVVLAVAGWSLPFLAFGRNVRHTDLGQEGEK
jgi:VanZ family protein